MMKLLSLITEPIDTIAHDALYHAMWRVRSQGYFFLQLLLIDCPEDKTREYNQKQFLLKISF